jgi:glutathione synthase/RimK-type ligase-like ATP-grasp enzyme
MAIILVTDTNELWLSKISGFQQVDVRDYLTRAEWSRRSGIKVYNLCQSYAYKSLGYYVSLLAEARGHRPFPTVRTIQDLYRNAAVRLIPDELEALIESSLAPIQSSEFTLSVYFGRNTAKRYDRLSRALFNLFQAPLLRFSFKRRRRWRLSRIRAIGTAEVPESHREFMVESAVSHFRRGTHSTSSRSKTRFDMAILHHPDEGDLAPSDGLALKRMLKAAQATGINAQLITNEDAARLLEFDALFIRETTAIDHHTYRLASRAEREGLVVMDDPLSILRCTNKVYLAELLQKHKVPTPRTIVAHRGNTDLIATELGFPCVLKRPDSAFSLGVAKVNDRDELEKQLNVLFQESELVIAQQYMRTDFDWRIGVLDQRGLYACKYHMARGHWQIAKHRDGMTTRWGKFETVPIELAPRKVVAVALKAANLIGDGLYGVDVKENDESTCVIEVNDNPNLDAGVEDAVLRGELYRRIMESFMRRIEEKKR